MNLERIFEAIVDPAPEALFCFCGDPRFQLAVETFRIEELGLPLGKFFPIGNGGGPTPLAYPTEMPSRCKWIVKQILFACQKFTSIKRAVLIAHNHCAYYSTVPGHTHGYHGQEERDLPLAGGLVKMISPHLTVENYHARLIQGNNQVKFNEVPISSEVTMPEFDWNKAYQPS